MIALLTLAVLVLIMRNMVKAKRISKLEKQAFKQRQAFDDFLRYVWDNAKFSDDNGIADKGYDSKQVEQKWDNFHRLSDKFYKGN